MLALCGSLAACGPHPGPSGTSTTTSTGNGGISYNDSPPDYVPVGGNGDPANWPSDSDGTDSIPEPVYSAPPPEIQVPITVPQLGQSGSDWNSGD